MAYVRRKGNQIAVVHGVRSPDTRNVEQRTLFTLYSKAEALAAVGDSSWQFRRILAEENPGVRFAWAKLDAEIRDNLDHLPDLYPYKRERVDDGFRAALRGFAKELMLADPQTLVASARLVQANRHELEYVRDLIDWRLKTCDGTHGSEFGQDNPFYWRAMAWRREVPPEAWEKLGALFQRGDYDEAEALARLLTECWPNFAEGYNYLGLVALEREELDAAAGFFDEAIKVGRSLLPKRVRKDSWWSDVDTRPYIRAIIYKSQALNRAGDHVGALLLCDRLEHECHQDVSAAVERIPVLLNAGKWEEAGQEARTVCAIYPWANLPLAFALFEIGDREEALVCLLRGVIEHPRAARIVLGLASDDPTCMNEARDHNTGVQMLRDLDAFLADRDEDFDRFFFGVLDAEPVKAAVGAYREARARWQEERGHDRTWFTRMKEMRTEEHARALAADVAAVLGW